MPFSAKDAAKYKKGLSDTEAQHWATVANNVLSNCVDSGGEDCEGKAIRIANSRTSTNKGFDQERSPAGAETMTNGQPVDAMAEKMLQHYHNGDYGDPVVQIPFDAYTATSFQDMEIAIDADERAQEIGELTDAFKRMIGNIMHNPNIQDKDKAISSLTAEFLERVNASGEEEEEEEGEEVGEEEKENGDTNISIPNPPADEIEEKSFLQKTIAYLSNLLGGVSRKNRTDESLLVWKEGDVYRWVARYSNSFRDNDQPREIISSKSHARFAELVDKGIEPQPELWLWHVKEWTVGRADWVTYDEIKPGVGFAVAGGHFYPEANWVAESLEKAKHPIGTSHGMPRVSLKRNQDDPTIIEEHITREISILPDWAKANPLADFHILPAGEQIEEEVKAMAIPADKREYIIKNWGIAPERLDALEAMNSADASKALSEDLDHKEATVTTQENEQGLGEVEEPTTKPTDGASNAESKSADAPNELPKEMQSMAALLKGVMDAALQPVLQRLDKLESQEQSASGDNHSDTKEMQELIPQASFGNSVLASIIGKEATRVDGRNVIAKSGPKLNQPSTLNPVGVTGVPFLDSILADHSHQETSDS